MARVFWDTNLFIYLAEDRGEKAVRVENIWRAMKSRGDRLYTSAMTVGEVLAKPMREGAREIEREYLRMFRGGSVVVLPFDIRVAQHYAVVRSDRSITPPDAIQLAVASAAEIDLFITNDERLTKKNIPGVKFISALDRAPY